MNPLGQARARALAKAAMWLVLLPFLLLFLGGAGYYAVDEFSRARLRAAGPPVTASVLVGIPGQSDRLFVKIGDNALKVDVRSWRGTGARRELGDEIQVVVDPDRPGNPDGGPFSDDFYGRAVLAREPYSVAVAARDGAVLFAGFLVLVSVVMLAPTSPRTVVAAVRDRHGTPARVVDVRPAAAPLPTWRRVLLSVVMDRRRHPIRYADVTVETPRGALRVPVLYRGTAPPPTDAAASFLGDARRGLLLLHEAPPGASAAMWTFRPVTQA